MYKILYLTQFEQIGGGETILLSLMEKLDRRLFEPIVIVPKKGQLSERLKNLNIKTHILNLPSYSIRTFFVPGASPPAIYKLAAIAKIIKPDLIHINHLTLTIYAGIVAKKFKIPLVGTAHGPWDSLYFYQDLITNFFVDKVLVPTQTIKNLMLKRKIINSRKIVTAPFAINTDKFKPQDKKLAKRKFALNKNDFVVTIVGRLDPAKDHPTFLKAALIVSKKIENSRFLIVGSKLGNFSNDKDYEKRIKKFLKENPTFAKKVMFKGFINDMPSIYNATDVLVSTSPSESFGLAQKEAASCGVPIVAISKNPQLIARRVLELFKNPTARISLGKLARNHIQKEFPLANYIGAVDLIYRQLLNPISP